MKHTFSILALIFILSNCKESPKFQTKLPNQAKELKTITSDSNSTIVLSTWRSIINTIQQRDYEEFKRLCLDTITVCDHKLLPERFFEKCSKELVNDLFVTRIKDTTKIDINNREVISSYYPGEFLSCLKSVGRTFIIKRVQVDLLDNEPYVIAFDFIETKKGVRFFSCDVYGGRDCCRSETFYIKTQLFVR